MKLISFSFILVLFSGVLYGQSLDSRIQYNIIVESESDDSSIAVSYEIIDLMDKSNSKSVDSIDELMRSLFQDLNKQPLEKQQVLFYVHGMWGGKRFAFNRTYKMIEKMYLEDSSSDIARIISIKWPGNKMEYKINKKKLYEIDQEVTRILNDFFQSFYFFRFAYDMNNVALDMLAHSLGTELIKEVICQMPIQEYKSEVIEHLILASPDLSTDVFKLDTCFGENLCLIKQATVYYSGRDLTLGVSNNLNDIDRLGRVGPSENSVIPGNVCFVDVTEIKDDTNLSDLMTGHSTFRASPCVAKDILSTLTNNPALKLTERNTVDEQLNKYKLKPITEQ